MAEKTAVGGALEGDRGRDRKGGQLAARSKAGSEPINGSTPESDLVRLCTTAPEPALSLDCLLGEGRIPRGDVCLLTFEHRGQLHTREVAVSDLPPQLRAVIDEVKETVLD